MVWLYRFTDYSKKIRETVKKDHPDNCVFAGYITGDVLQGAYSGADLFLYPSYEETEGIVVLEALASSQKVLVRDIPVYNDWLHDGFDCYKASNLDEFDKRLNEILAGKVKNVSKAGHEVALKRDVSLIGPQLKKLMKKLCLCQVRRVDEY